MARSRLSCYTSLQRDEGVSYVIGMTASQAWAFGAFVIVMLILALAMTPASRRLDGRQKYRRNRIPGP